MNLEPYRLPNGLIGVAFKRTWNAYKAGSLAAFADQQALELQQNGIVDLRGLGGEHRAAPVPLRAQAPAVPAVAPSETVAAETTMAGEGAAVPSEVEIPEDWASQHHTKIMALARELGVEVTTKAEAEAVIREELERRAAA